MVSSNSCNIATTAKVPVKNAILKEQQCDTIKNVKPTGGIVSKKVLSFHC